MCASLQLFMESIPCVKLEFPCQLQRKSYLSLVGPNFYFFCPVYHCTSIADSSLTHHKFPLSYHLATVPTNIVHQRDSSFQGLSLPLPNSCPLHNCTLHVLFWPNILFLPILGASSIKKSRQPLKMVPVLLQITNNLESIIFKLTGKKKLLEYMLSTC